jgi:hypothetical protein
VPACRATLVGLGDTNAISSDINPCGFLFEQREYFSMGYYCRGGSFSNSMFECIGMKLNQTSIIEHGLTLQLHSYVRDDLR